MTINVQILQKSDPKASDRIIHPLFVRLTQWNSAFALFMKIMNGRKIYNAAPVYPLQFPPDITPGGWLAGALAGVFAKIWLLSINGIVYLVYGVVSGHYWRSLIRFQAMAAYRNIRLELKPLILHGPGEHNPVQRVLYNAVIWIVILLVFSGLTMWKPVQFQSLAHFFGGYDEARKVHFFATLGLALFTLIHLSIAMAVKGTIESMFSGRLAQKPPKKIGAPK
jgi:thiosulfate reductase cytochrome b subunit